MEAREPDQAVDREIQAALSEVAKRAAGVSHSVAAGFGLTTAGLLASLRLGSRTWPPRYRRSRKRMLCTAAAMAVLAGAVVAKWSAVAGSVAVLGHLRWAWVPAAIMLEWASMVAFARTLRRLLTAGRARFRLLPMLATVYAANAVSVSVPLAGPELATAFTFRRITRQGADAPLAGWSLLAGGVASTAAVALVLAVGGLASGNVLAAATAIPGGVLAAAVLVAFAGAARRPRLRSALERPASWVLQHGSRLVHRPVADPGQVIRVWAGRLGELRLSPAGWMKVTGWAAANWLADAGVLAVSILAVGAAVPWPDLLLAYGAGIAAQSFSVTPGGLGVAEGTLSLALVAAGLHASQALAAVLLYRLVSFWLVTLAGWLILLWLRHRGGMPPAPRGPDTAAMPADITAAQATDPPGPEGQHAAETSRPRPPGRPGTPVAHELVLLHGQPGSADDWREVMARLPARLHAVAADRPGYGSSQAPAGGFAANAHAVLDDLDARGVGRAVLAGHSWGGGVALSAATLAPHRVDAVVLLASVGPGCVTIWDRLLAAPGAGPLCALAAWQWTPWIARARLARIQRRRGSPPDPSEFVTWQLWAHTGGGRVPLWRTFLAEQRALLRELGELETALGSVQTPVLLIADPGDRVVPVDTACRLVRALPDARLQLIPGAGHLLPRRAPGPVADAIVAFLAALDNGPDGIARSCPGRGGLSWVPGGVCRSPS
jgi:uncharacterized membrane protein YbhN (UPF0104 family)/pimeloyl-ACP methyl ester carboxylesterase